MIITDRISCEILKFHISPCSYPPEPLRQTVLLMLLLLLSLQVVSDSLQLHGLQHARLPCPSRSPQFRSSSCPLIGTSYNNAPMTSERQPQNSACRIFRKTVFDLIFTSWVSTVVGMFLCTLHADTHFQETEYQQQTILSAQHLHQAYHILYLNNFMYSLIYLFTLGRAGPSVPPRLFSR